MKKSDVSGESFKSLKINMYSDRDEYVESNRYYYCGDKHEVPPNYCTFGSRHRCLKRGFGACLYKDKPKRPVRMVKCEMGALKIEKPRRGRIPPRSPSARRERMSSRSPNPRRGSPSPRRGSPSPRRGSPSPRRGSPSPRRGSPSPRRGSPKSKKRKS